MAPGTPLPVTLKILVSIAVLAWITHGMDVGAVQATLAAVDWIYIGAAVALLAALTALQAWRWGLVMTALGAPVHSLERLINCFIGQFFNQTLPSTVGGDAVRIVLLRKTLPLRIAANGVLIDRLCALFALLLMGLAGLPWLAQLESSSNAIVTVGVALLCGFAGMFTLLFADRLPQRIRANRVGMAMSSLSIDARKAMLNAHPGPLVLLTSVVVHTHVSGIIWLIALGLDLPVTLGQALVLVPLVMIVSAIPISVAGWGVREGAMVAALGLVGTPAEGAFAVSILFGLTLVLVGLPGGALWLGNRGGGAQPAAAVD
jgi:glycosyltransferase 2 family protein